jgi:hypothetical protein
MRLGARLLLAAVLAVALGACQVAPSSLEDHPYRYMPQPPLGAGGGG